MLDAIAFTTNLLTLLTRELLWVVAGAILLSGIDDLVVDLVWLLAPQTPDMVDDAATPGRYAILIPAWDEAAVIGAMLTRLCATLDHPHWRAFVGVYPNDPATRAAVLAVGDPRVTLVTTRRPGPTTKADCLNHLWRAMRLTEAGEARFTAVVLHDAEDVVHPRELRVFDAALRDAALAQLPVLPLPDPRSTWIAGHYLDEFAEAHAKDMTVRARLGVAIPSAGVATAVRRDVLERLDADAPFDASSLTEDYELGHRLHRLGLRARFVRAEVAGELVQTREFFPATLDDAVRQKSRWLLGIALNGWDRLGWHGGPVDRWMLLRDRKGLYTAGVTLLAYALMALMLALAGLAAVAGTPRPVADAPAALRLLLAANTALLAWRLLLRAGFTTQAAGLAEGLRSVPRAFVGNAINALAAARAVRRYRAMRATGAAPAWDKTAHRFPAA